MATVSTLNLDKISNTREGITGMKVTTKGQVTIPRHIRKYLGISAYSEVDFAIRDDEAVLLKLPKNGEETSGVRRFRRLRGLKKAGMSTEKWMEATRGD